MSTVIRFSEDAGNLETDSNSSNSAEDPRNINELQVHYLPFKIQHDGQRDNIGTKFCDKIMKDKDDSNVLQNYFRGRSIQGDTIKLNGYEGIVVVETAYADANGADKGDGDDAMTNPNDKHFKVTSKFDKLTYWNWDKIPTQMDSPVKLLDWLELAQVLHAPSEMDPPSDSTPVTDKDVSEHNEAGNP